MGPIPLPAWIWPAEGLPGVSQIIINILLTLGAVIAVIMLILGVYQYITAGGNPEQAQKAKNTIFGTIIGVIIVFASYLIINYIVIKLTAPLPAPTP